MVGFTHLEDGVQLIGNEDGKFKCPFNRLIPGRAPVLDINPDFIFGPENMADPGTVGIHRTYGTVILSRVGQGGRGTCASLTDEDLKKWLEVLRWMEP